MQVFYNTAYLSIMFLATALEGWEEVDCRDSSVGWRAYIHDRVGEMVVDNGAKHVILLWSRNNPGKCLSLELPIRFRGKHIGVDGRTEIRD